MGLLRKMAFWKRDDAFDLPLDQPAPAADLFASEPAHPWPAPEPLTPNFSPSAKSGELELLNSKLDTIKAMLVSLEQRLSNLERNLGAPQQEKRLW